MAHQILVRIDVDDEYKDIHPQITADDYMDGSKARGWEAITERMFTESEVRSMVKDMLRIQERLHSEKFGMDVDYVESSLVVGTAAKHGITIDPS